MPIEKEEEKEDEKPTAPNWRQQTCLRNGFDTCSYIYTLFTCCRLACFSLKEEGRKSEGGGGGGGRGGWVSDWLFLNSANNKKKKNGINFSLKMLFPHFSGGVEKEKKNNWWGCEV